MINILRRKTLRSTAFEFAILFTLAVPIGVEKPEVEAWANANLLEGVRPTVDSVKFTRHEFDADYNLWNVVVSGDHQFGGES